MKRRGPGLLGLMLVLAAGAASAAPPASVVREMDALVEALATSGCEFQRNGRWHDADEAADHLRRKQAWLLKRGLIDSTEQFIARAGSESSISGRPYRVRCGDHAEVTSAEWLNEALDALRARTPPSR